MADLRASDLRLTGDEVQRWLGDRLPELPAASIQELGERTEGWAAGLQLALSSLAGSDPARSGEIVQRLAAPTTSSSTIWSARSLGNSRPMCSSFCSTLRCWNT